MSLLHPFFLVALVAVVIPILIHLINVRRKRVYYFSSNRFLELVKVEKRSVNRIRELIILLLRIAGVILIVLFFAIPILKRENGLNKSELRVFIDNVNYSYDLTPNFKEKNTLFEIVTSIVGLGNDESFFEFHTNTVIAGKGIRLTKIDALDFLNQLGNWKAQRTNSVKLLSFIEEGDGIIISSFNSSTLEVLKTVVVDDRRITLIPIMVDKSDDLFVDTLISENLTLLSDKQTFTVQVNKLLDENEVGLKLVANGVEAVSLKEDLNEKRRISFDVGANQYDYSRSSLELESGVGIGSNFYFSYSPVKTVNVVEIFNGELQTSFHALFANKLFRFSRYASGSIDYSIIDEADFIILNSVQNLDASVIALLKRRNAEGLRILIIPPTNNILNLIGEILNKNLVQFETDSQILPIKLIDLENPFYGNVFEEKRSSIQMPNGRPFFRWTGSKGDLLKFKNEQPFLGEVGVETNVFLLASPLNDTYTDFHKNALFVPVMQQLAFTSAHGSFDRLYYTLNESTITLAVPIDLPKGVFKLVRDDSNYEFVPDQQLHMGRLRLDISENEMVPGFYKLMLDTLYLKTLAFNYSKEYLGYKALTSEEVREQLRDFPNFTILDETAVNELAAGTNPAHGTDHVWKYFVIAAMLILFAEILASKYI